MLYTRIFELKILENIKNPDETFGEIWKILRTRGKHSEILSLTGFFKILSPRYWVHVAAIKTPKAKIIGVVESLSTPFPVLLRLTNNVWTPFGYRERVINAIGMGR